MFHRGGLETPMRRSCNDKEQKACFSSPLPLSPGNGRLSPSLCIDYECKGNTPARIQAAVSVTVP